MGRTATGNSSQSYTGSLDEVRIWNTALDNETVSAWQNQELTNSHPDISALQAYYKFNEGLGTTANDLTADYLGSYESDGTITGTVWEASDISDFTPYDDEDLQEDTVEGNAALSFTGADENYVDCGSDSELQMGTHDLTVEFWLNTSAAETQKIISNGGQADSDDGYSIKILSNGKLKAEVSDGTTQLVKQTTVIVNDGNWHHCSVVFDRDHQLRVCVDGTCVTNLMEPLSDLNCDNTNDTFVMGRTATGNSSQSYTGNLDEVRIWNTALTGTVIADWRKKEVNDSHPNISDLQIYYKCNEGTGTTANDVSSNAYKSNGIIYNAQWVKSDIPEFK